MKPESHSELMVEVDLPTAKALTLVINLCFRNSV